LACRLRDAAVRAVPARVQMRQLEEMVGARA